MFPKNVLTSSTARKLGPLVDEDEDYVLRIFAANIVRGLCCIGTEPHEFWPQIRKQKKSLHEDFPLAQTPGSDWMRHIANYLSNKDVNRKLRGDS